MGRKNTSHCAPKTFQLPIVWKMFFYKHLLKPKKSEIIYLKLGYFVFLPTSSHFSGHHIFKNIPKIFPFIPLLRLFKSFFFKKSFYFIILGPFLMCGVSEKIASPPSK